MFAQDRLDAMDTLRRYSDDHENNQRILYIVMQVCCFNGHIYRNNFEFLAS